MESLYKGHIGTLKTVLTEDNQVYLAIMVMVLVVLV